MSGIAIVGTGISGLHLALHLQRHGRATTVYAERSPDELRSCRLPNLVCRFEHTRVQERELSVDHWPLAGFETSCAHVSIEGSPVSFRGDLRRPRQLRGLPSLPGPAAGGLRGVGRTGGGTGRRR
jgi:hypothetical protein